LPYNYPDKVEEWKLENINELIKLKDIEDIKFDFKDKDLNEGKGLSSHICAMANTVGGFIVLGIDEIKKKNNEIIRFDKDGFKTGKEDIVKQSISNYISQIDPLPDVNMKKIDESNSETFYFVIEIISNENKKPYFIKNQNLCYVRIGNTSIKADRNTILNLYSKFEEKKKEFFYLKSAIIQLKEDFSQCIHEINEMRKNWITESTIIVPIDTKLVKDLISRVDWEILGNSRNILGETIIGNTQTIGFIHKIKKIEKINLYIEKFNSIENIDRKFAYVETIKGNPNFFTANGDGTKEMVTYLNGMCTSIDQALISKSHTN